MREKTIYYRREEVVAALEKFPARTWEASAWETSTFYDWVKAQAAAFIPETAINDKLWMGFYESNYIEFIKNEILSKCKPYEAEPTEFYTIEEACAELEKMGFTRDTFEDSDEATIEPSEPAAPVSSETAPPSSITALMNLSALIGFVQGTLRESSDPKMKELNALIDRCWIIRNERSVSPYQEMMAMRGKKVS